jgi:hypothetical protein
MNVGAVARRVRARAGLWLAGVASCLASVRPSVAAIWSLPRRLALLAGAGGGVQRSAAVQRSAGSNRGGGRQLLAALVGARAPLQRSARSSQRPSPLRIVVQMSAGAARLARVVQRSVTSKSVASKSVASKSVTSKQGRGRQLLAMWSGARAWLQAQLQKSAGGRQLARVVQMSAGGGWLDVGDASRNMQASRRLRAGELQRAQRSSRPRGVSFRGKRLRRNAGQSQTSDLDLAQR